MDTQIIYGNCPSKSNCYKVVTINGHSSLSKTKALKAYEETFFIQCDKYRNANISGYFELYLRVYYPSQRSDLDNSLKVVLDCLQRVKAIGNDNKCVKIKNAHALNLQSKKPKEMPNKGPSDIAIRYDRKAIAADLSAEQLEEIFRELDNYFAQKQPPKQTLHLQNYENKQRAI